MRDVELLSSPESDSPAAEETQRTSQLLAPSDTFVHRHIGPTSADISDMLDELGYDSLDDLINATVPADIRLQQPLKVGQPRGEFELLQELAAMASANVVRRSMIGMGFYDTITPPV